MRRDRKVCERKDCLTKTCSFHYKHLPKWYNKAIIWVDNSETCGIYKSMDRWRTLFEEEYFDKE